MNQHQSGVSAGCFMSNISLGYSKEGEGISPFTLDNPIFYVVAEPLRDLPPTSINEREKKVK